MSDPRTPDGDSNAGGAERRAGDEVALLDLRPLDLRFGRALGRWADAAIGDEARALVERIGLRLSAELGRQNTCIDIDLLAAEQGWPSAERMIDVLRRGGLLSTGGEAMEAAVETPLVLDGRRLYLLRYHRYELALTRALLARAAPPMLDDARCDELAPRLAALFDSDAQPDWQRVAAATALDRRLAVIAGGPGTGKTTTVARLLALLLEASDSDHELRIRLAAPTGKAAARLTDSLRAARGGLEDIGIAPDVIDLLPTSASTLHRLLGYRARENQFVHGPEQPLPVDVVVVDEASMVDLSLMSQLVAALPSEARLVLLGDPDQLASVEAGRVLGDLCAWTTLRGRRGRYTRAGAARLERLVGTDLAELGGDDAPPLADALCVLEHSHRFDAGGALGRFARSVNVGDAQQAAMLLERSDAGLQSIPTTDTTALLQEAVDGYVEAVARCDEQSPDVVLSALSRFQVLCAGRHGPRGVERMNQAIEQGLRRRGAIADSDAQYAGRPVMITVNDYGLGLFNGDVGVVLRDERGAAHAWFLAPDRSLRSIRASRLPAHETAFAMTVHKSQGSEFDTVLVVLGDDEPRLLTRELLYTAVTRARERVVLCSSTRALQTCIEARSERRSGLRERLWPAADA